MTILLTLLDGLVAFNRSVFLIGASNSPNSIDEALRRPGRLDRELEIGIPSESSRLAIFRSLLDKVSHNIPSQELEQISNQTHGFVGADISLLIKEAILLMMKDKKRNVLETKDLLNALSFVKPSALREVLTIHIRFSPYMIRLTLQSRVLNGTIFLVREIPKSYYKMQSRHPFAIPQDILNLAFARIREFSYMVLQDVVRPCWQKL